jgi:hypothetical protein
MRRQKVVQAQGELATGAAFDDRGFVFTEPLGGI